MERLAPSTLFRAQRLKRRKRLRNGPLTGAMMQGLLAGHVSYPDSICSHEDEDEPEAMRIATLTSVIMDLGGRVKYVTDGLPRANDYAAVTLAA